MGVIAGICNVDPQGAGVGSNKSGLLRFVEHSTVRVDNKRPRFDAGPFIPARCHDMADARHHDVRVKPCPQAAVPHFQGFNPRTRNG